jgi:cytoskeletal protein CcmA (bactofilin family)
MQPFAPSKTFDNLTPPCYLPAGDARHKACNLELLLPDGLLKPIKGLTMSQKRNEGPNKPAKVKLFKNPIRPVETTIVSAGSKLQGIIETGGTLVIDGSVTGTIRCGSLEIMAHGNVDANVEAETVHVAGSFQGEMNCRGKLTFFRTGRVKGNVSYGTLSIESGGLLDGTASQLK